MNDSPPPDLKRTKRQKHTGGHSSQIDRLPPNSPEVEQAVLGCILLSPNDCLPECIEKLRDNGSEVFYDLRHQTIFDCLQKMFQNREPIDLITLQQKLKDGGMLDQIGGIPYLFTLQDSVPSAANLSYYLEYAIEKHLLRKMVSICTQTVGRIYDFEGEVPTLLDEIERDILKVSESRTKSSTLPTKQLVSKALETVESILARKGAITGLETGFIDFDKMTDGLHPGEMIVIAARPSMGKTSLAMNIAEHIALESKLPVGVFSLEMSAESLTLRMLCSLARVSIRAIKDGFLSESEYPKLVSAAGKLSKAPLHIDDEGGMNILQLRARARRMHQQHGIKALVIDYLQLLSSVKRSIDNRQQEIADISSGIKALAKELGIPVIVLSQMNREIEKEKNRKPRLSDLRESGAIEQDADVVGLLYKPNAGEDDTPENALASQVNLVVAKQRNGPTGDVNLTFLKPYTRFQSASNITEQDLPNRQ